MPKKACRNSRCPALIPDNETYCPRCLAALPPSPCRGEKCNKVVDPPNRYCPECWKKKMKAYDTKRGSARERGYTTRWDKFVKHYLDKHPLCEKCLAIGRTEPVDEVHHIVPVSHGGNFFSEENVIGLCFSCHRREEAKARKLYGTGSS